LNEQEIGIGLAYQKKKGRRAGRLKVALFDQKKAGELRSVGININEELFKMKNYS
jgi:hypothetical protein